MRLTLVRDGSSVFMRSCFLPIWILPPSQRPQFLLPSTTRIAQESKSLQMLRIRLSNAQFCNLSKNLFLHQYLKSKRLSYWSKITPQMLRKHSASWHHSLFCSLKLWPWWDQTRHLWTLQNWQRRNWLSLISSTWISQWTCKMQQSRIDSLALLKSSPSLLVAAMKKRD